MNKLHILMAEDSASDAELAREAFKGGEVVTDLSIVDDGVEAISYLKGEGRYADRVMPDLIILDLNMPRMDGKAVLRKLKKDVDLRKIPVVVLTTSQDQIDIIESYDLAASCYITKPMSFDKFLDAATAIKEFYFSVAKLPKMQSN